MVASHNVVEETQTESTGTSDDENLKQVNQEFFFPYIRYFVRFFINVVLFTTVGLSECFATVLA